jgi:hypothetical protein
MIDTEIYIHKLDTNAATPNTMCNVNASTPYSTAIDVYQVQELFGHNASRYGASGRATGSTFQAPR